MRDQAQRSANPGGCNSKASTNIEEEDYHSCSYQTAHCQVRIRILQMHHVLSCTHQMQAYHNRQGEAQVCEFAHDKETG